MSESWGLRTLAGNTGGVSSKLSWADHGALERAITESSGFYRASFAADEGAPASPQRLEVKTTRKKVKVRTSATIVLRQTP